LKEGIYEKQTSCKKIIKTRGLEKNCESSTKIIKLLRISLYRTTMSILLHYQSQLILITKNV